MSLHLVFTTAGLRACQPRADADDVMLLIGDGVYAGLAADTSWPCAVQALQDDAAARGVTDRLHVDAIGYDDFVALCTKHKPIVSWTN